MFFVCTTRAPGIKNRGVGMSQKNTRNPKKIVLNVYLSTELVIFMIWKS